MKKIVLILLLFFLFQAAVSAQEAKVKINHSLIAFTIPEKDLIPENIAYDPITKAFFIGSTRKGKVIKIANNGEQTHFINPKQDGLYMVVGMKVDAKNRWLWVCSSGGSNLKGYALDDEKEGRPAGIFKFDLGSGKLIKKYMLNAFGEIHFFNDLVVDSNGNAYLTHMFEEHAIYTIQKNKDVLELFLAPLELKYPNGITISDNGKSLFVAHSEGIGRIDIISKKWTALQNPNNIKIARMESIDGIYFYKNTLIAIQPGINTVQQFFLDEKLNTITGSRLLEVNHPMMDNPTTGVLTNNQLYYIANAQFGSFDKDGKLFPMEQLYEPAILKVNVSK